MKRINLFLIAALSSLLIASCTQTPESDNATTSDAKEVSETSATDEVYTIDVPSTTLKWIGTKITAHHVGIFPVTGGKIYVKENNITGGEVNISTKDLKVTGPTGSDNSMNTKLQGHLISDDFFQTEKYPTAHFAITEITPFSGTAEAETNDNRQAEITEYKVLNPTHTISGNLTIKDVTKHITFPAFITFSDNSVEAKAKFNINRKNWNITYPGMPNDLIRDEVHIGFALKALKQPLSMND